MKPPLSQLIDAATGWFILGREPLLSTAELTAVFSLTKFDYHWLNTRLPIVRGELTPNEPAAELLKRLGGTIKIGREIGWHLTEAELIETMIKDLETVEGKKHFGISGYGSPLQYVERWGREIKNRLKAAGHSARFVFNREPVLSSVTVEKNGLTKRGREFLVASTDKKIYALARTLAVQPFADWSRRDYGRPGRDDLSGMLPPKLALMMINIAAASHPKLKILLDPFCGSGTILSEALIIGYRQLIGCDLSAQAIADTEKNFDWLARNYSRLSAAYSLRLFQSDIRDLAKKLPPRSVDAIITEPYLGPPLRGHETLEQIKKTSQELTGLYTDAFGQFAKILKPNGRVVFAFPRFLIKNHWHTITDKIMPRLQALGFAPERLLPADITPASYLLYHRPGQHIGREIWKFRLAIDYH